MCRTKKAIEGIFFWSCDNCNSSSLADIAFEQSELKLKIAKLEKIRGKSGHNVRSSKSFQTEIQLVFSETERDASVVKQSRRHLSYAVV